MDNNIAIPERVTIKTGNGGLRYLDLRFNGAEAHVYLHGAHVLHYQPAGQQPVLWHSKESYFEANKPIRGGIPVCWPWFGAHASDATRPMHGFARLAEWTPVESGATATATTVTLRLPASQGVNAIAELTVILDTSLAVTLTSINTGDAAIPLSEALHSYFAVRDIRSASVTGLAGQPYIDKLPAERPILTQTGPVTFTAETDRVYTDSSLECVIIDPVMRRRIRISKQNSLSTVIWNPWITKAARMPDFGDNEYTEMLCVETANCDINAFTLPAGKTHAMTTRISVDAE
jgi:D-hexose-6-phosphate mutarotase